jgi:ferritin
MASDTFLQWYVTEQVEEEADGHRHREAVENGRRFEYRAFS